jgi:hypothetical protein
MKIKYFSGIDVQISRGCSYYIIDNNKSFISSGWIKDNIPDSIKNLFSSISDNHYDQIAIGIDAPRMPITKLRKRTFDRKNNRWIENNEGKIGRECEVLIKSYNIANPQWTNTLENSEDWMKLGYSIFSKLIEFPFVYEVFPSASYRMLAKENIKYELCLNGFNGGVKDMLDASVAAVTVYEFINLKGCEVGGGDGLGTIVMPRKIEDFLSMNRSRFD